MIEEFNTLVRDLYKTSDVISLHEPSFIGKEKEYLSEVISSTFVSSVGKSIGEFEKKIASYMGVDHAVATSNGTSALHLSLLVSGVSQNTEVITQSLTFVATCNAIDYCGASPVFVDIDKETLSMSPLSLLEFLDKYAEVRDDGSCWNKTSGKEITACLPMHSYGFPAAIEEINLICSRFNIPLVEDCAESLGSFYHKKHTGSESLLCALSFNGNKIITTGGGGMVLTNNLDLSNKVRHLSTVAKVEHPWEFNHDKVGFNYRMPNLNAALGLAQIESLDKFLVSKKSLASCYYDWGKERGMVFHRGQQDTSPNYWLNCLITENLESRDKFIRETNKNNIRTRPSWNPAHSLPPYKDCQRDRLENTSWVFERLVNVPSSPILDL